MARSPSGLLTDQPPAWSIRNAARPITDVPGIMGPEGWTPGINLWWREATATRWRHPSGFDGTDTDIATIADPAVWPEAVTTTPDVVAYPYGTKDAAADPQITGFRSFTIYAPSVHQELSQQAGPVGALAADDLEAHISREIMAEFADSLYTKNPGLYRTAVDQSAATAVDPVVSMATLYEAHGDAGGSGDAVISVPYHALPFLFRRRLVEWQGTQLVDVYGNPIVTAPGYVGRGPLTDPDDLETSQTPATGEGWFYISHRPYVGVGEFQNRVQGERGSTRGIYAKGNTETGLVEAPAIVVFRPARVFAVNTNLNESL